MLSGAELRDKRVLARISGRVLCERAGVARGRLSDIERGYVRPPEAELVGRLDPSQTSNGRCGAGMRLASNRALSVSPPEPLQMDRRAR
jgi:hypothetical protein